MTGDTYSVYRAPAFGVELLSKPAVHADIALVRAQSLALELAGPASYYVVRRARVGPPATIYRVDRDEAGDVLTHTIERED